MSSPSHADPVAASPAAVPPASGAPHWAFIDALRGCAVLMVILVHTRSRVPWPGRLDTFMKAGNFGVQLFFVVSALTLFMSYDSRHARERHPAKAFLARRLFRIGPLFWLAIPIYVTFYFLVSDIYARQGVFVPDVIATVFFLHGWHPRSINAIVPGGWSIAVEMNFYCLVPLAFARITTLKRAVLALVGSFGASLAISVLVRRVLVGHVADSLLQDFVYYWLPRQLPVFGLGFLLFFLMKAARAMEPSARRALAWLPWLALGGLLFVCAFNDHVPMAYFVVACGFAVLALGLSVNPLPLIVNRFTNYVGTISYSAYLTHFLVLEAVCRLWFRGEQVAPAASWSRAHIVVAGLGIYGAAVLGTLVLATITYRAIELPGQALGRRFIAARGWGRIKDRASSSTAA